MESFKTPSTGIRTNNFIPNHQILEGDMPNKRQNHAPISPILFDPANFLADFPYVEEPSSLRNSLLDVPQTPFVMKESNALWFNETPQTKEPTAEGTIGSRETLADSDGDGFVQSLDEWSQPI